MSVFLCFFFSKKYKKKMYLFKINLNSIYIDLLFLNNWLCRKKSLYYHLPNLRRSRDKERKINESCGLNYHEDQNDPTTYRSTWLTRFPEVVLLFVITFESEKSSDSRACVSSIYRIIYTWRNHYNHKEIGRISKAKLITRFPSPNKSHANNLLAFQGI